MSGKDGINHNTANHFHLQFNFHYGSYRFQGDYVYPVPSLKKNWTRIMPKGTVNLTLILNPDFNLWPTCRCVFSVWMFQKTNLIAFGGLRVPKIKTVGEIISSPEPAVVVHSSSSSPPSLQPGPLPDVIMSSIVPCCGVVCCKKTKKIRTFHRRKDD